ncbi:hypothetical protein [Marimonas arenosa]|uniref:DUF4034 domain-containing protein n=1 Tax=Marimonas arenosa TaxID=1795305 RepID=A0AAE3WFN6_9RHOB|nr:hypothetical protein [Marimonas arenosa]MDQ2091545.1 hypothetical protein [Marimonas arenosa]
MLTAARQTAWTLVAITRYLARLARNLIVLPVVIYRTIRLIVTDTNYEPDADQLRAQLLLPLAEDTEAQDRKRRLDEIRDLVDRHDWDTLLARLEAWEGARRQTPGRSSLVTEALLTIREVATPDPGAVVVRSDLIDAFEDGLDDHPDNHLMAATVAMAHIGLGWHWRGEGYAVDISPIDEQRFIGHFTRAAEVLAPFDAIERYSPALALAQYHLFACHPQAGTLIEDWFADWADLDPQSINPYLLHGFQLLPRWFGADAAALDHAALRAVAGSEDTLGRAAYPLLYLGTMEEADAEVLARCDADLFLDGLRDLLERTPSQHLVNRVAWQLHRAWKTRPIAPDNDDTARAVTALRARLGEGFRMVVSDYLHIGLPAVWGGEDETLWYVAQAFSDELQAGATIRFGENGAEIDAAAR